MSTGTRTGQVTTLAQKFLSMVGQTSAVTILNVMATKSPAIAHLFFDINTWMGDNGATSIKLKDKFVEGITPSLTEDGTRVTWMETGGLDFFTHISEDQTLAVTTTGVGDNKVAGVITGVKLNAVSGFSVNDSLFITAAVNSLNIAADADEIDADIVAVNPDGTVDIRPTMINNLLPSHVDFPTSVELVAEQKVIRGYWKRNDEEQVTKSFADRQGVTYGSYFQHFGRRLNIKKQSLNVSYAHYASPYEAIKDKISFNVGILIQELEKALIKGKNVGPGNSANQKSEMLGLDTLCAKLGSVYDLADSTDPLGDLVYHIQESQASGAVGANERVALLGNRYAIMELTKQDRHKLINTTYKIDRIEYSVPRLMTAYGEVPLFASYAMDMLFPYPVFYTLPQNKVKLWIRQDQAVNISENGSSVSGIKSATTMRIVPIQLPGNHESQVFDMFFEAGTIYAGQGAEAPAYRKITNYVSAG